MMQLLVAALVDQAVVVMDQKIHQVVQEQLIQAVEVVVVKAVMVVLAVTVEVVSLSLDTPRRREILTAGNGHVDEVVLLLA
jgi:hypothetical protein